jgi:hypothetical protein
VLKGAIAHLRFVTILSRTATPASHVPSPILALARSENSKQRFHSLSAQIRQERKSY